MPAKLVDGRWVSSYEQEEEEKNPLAPVSTGAGVQLPPENMSPMQSAIYYSNQYQQQMLEQELNNAQAPDKPIVSGATITDTIKAVPNALLAVPTDLVDLGLGLVDVARATASSAGMGEFGWDQVFDDSDNPLTELRRDTLGTSETYAGEFISTGLRIGTLVASVAYSGRLDRLPLIGTRIGALGNLVNKVRGVSKAASTAQKTTRALDGIRKGTQAASGINKAAKFAQSNSYLQSTYKAIAEIPEAASWWKRTTTTASALAKAKIKPKTLAETFAWDMFAAFNVMGEGVDELDETVLDLARDVGIDVPTDLTSNIYDTSFDRKIKGLLDGLLIGSIGGALVDLFRIKRYAKAIKKASPAERRQLIKALTAESNQLGTSVASLAEKRFARYGDPNSAVQNALAQREGLASDLDQGGFENFAKAQPGDLPPGVNPALDPFDYEAGGLPPGQRGGELVRLNESIDTARAAQQSAAELAAQRVPYPDNAPGGTAIQPVNVTVLGQSNVEATVTPQTIRGAVREALDMGMQLPEVKERVMQLLPQKRINQVDFLTSGPIGTNSQGVIDGVDSIWLNAITERGLREGWMQVDPDTLQQVYNRKAALELDRLEAIGRMGQGIDQADDAARYQQWLEGKEPMNPGSMDPQVQGRLGEMENPQQAAVSAARPEGPDESAQLQQWLQQQEGANQVNNVNPPNDAIQDRLAQMDANSAYDQWEAQQANPAVAAGERDAAIGANELDALDDEQMGRLAADVVAEDNPFDVVADGLGIDANNIPRADVVKAEVGRGWDVVGVDGESIGRFTTKKQAIKAAEREDARMLDELQRRAQQQLDDGADQVLRIGEPAMVRRSEVQGKLKLSDAQIRELQRYPGLESFTSQFQEGKKTFVFTQAQMDELADGIKAMLQTEGLPTNRRRVLNKLAEKLDVQVQRLAPQARVQLMADQLLSDSDRFLSHGDYC